jgi:hypothetical protein
MANNDVPVTRTAKGRAYEAYIKELDHMAESSDPKTKDLWNAANDDVRRMKMTPAEVHQNPILTNLVMMYHNDQSIGLRCMPQIMTGGSLSAQYFAHDARSLFSVDDDTVADGGLPTEINQTVSKPTVTLLPRALMELVSESTVQNATDPLKPLVTATKAVMYRLDNARENRIATAVMTAGNYGANTGSVGVSDRWNSATGGDPAGVVDAGKDACFRGDGNNRIIGVTSPAVWTVLKRHNRFSDAVKYAGMPSSLLQAAAEWLELDEILIGRKWYESTNEGIAAASATYARLWANSFAILCVANDPMVETASFGYTFQDKTTSSEQIYEAIRGARGSYVCKAGHNDVAQVVGPLTSYLITTPIG